MPRALRSRRAGFRGALHRRWPGFLAVACAVLALAWLAQGWNMLRLHSLLDEDADLIEAAGAQRSHAQQIGRLAALMAADADARSQHAAALRAVLDTAAEDATALDERLARQRPPGARQDTAVVQALLAWQAAHDRLWRRSRALLVRNQAAEPADLLSAVLDVQADTTPVLAAAQQLSAALRLQAQQRHARHWREGLLGLVVGAALLLLLLGPTLLAPKGRVSRRHAARRPGGGWVRFGGAVHERAAPALAAASDPQPTLPADGVIVFYQPVVDLQTRRPVGVEAVVRRRQSDGGWAAPAAGIAAGEACGADEDLGSHGLRTACRAFVRWRRELGSMAPGHLAVNLSWAQLQRGGLVAELRDLLQQTAMRPDQLQLEITESLATQDEPVQATLRALKSLGVRLALDDFGSGHSSLACLHRLPLDTVKVDGSLVRHAETVEYQRVLIEATIRVARTLGMTTVTAGIETEGQATLMSQLECHHGQGDLHAPPLEAAAYETWLRQVQEAPAS